MGANVALPDTLLRPLHLDAGICGICFRRQKCGFYDISTALELILATLPAILAIFLTLGPGGLNYLKNNSNNNFHKAKYFALYLNYI